MPASPQKLKNPADKGWANDEIQSSNKQNQKSVVIENSTVRGAPIVR